MAQRAPPWSGERLGGQRCQLAVEIFFVEMSAGDVAVLQHIANLLQGGRVRYSQDNQIGVRLGGKQEVTCCVDSSVASLNRNLFGR